MQINATAQNGITIFALSGSIDTLTASAVTESFKSGFASGNYKLIADLAEVAYISSAGVHALLSALKQARQHGGDLRIAQPRPAVRQVLDLSGFSHLAQFFPNVPDALASFNE